MAIVTKSHIDEQHAQSQYFPMAESEDGLFSWISGADGYVQITCEFTGLPANTPSGKYSLYLQYAELRLGKDQGLTPELIAAARAFSRAVDEEKSRRAEAAERAAWTDWRLGRVEIEKRALERAAASGKPEIVDRVMCVCDGSAVDCSTDVLVTWIRPDGSRYETRTHTH